MGKTAGGYPLKKKKHSDKLVIGGLHKDDFEWASKQHEEIGYVLVAFLLDHDGYHWKAVYAKISDLKRLEGTT
jgi:hypothetical protein